MIIDLKISGIKKMTVREIVNMAGVRLRSRHPDIQTAIGNAKAVYLNFKKMPRKNGALFLTYEKTTYTDKDQGRHVVKNGGYKRRKKTEVGQYDEKKT